jgi:hypothetical protein
MLFRLRKSRPHARRPASPASGGSGCSLHRAATSQHQAATPQRRSRPRVKPHPKTPSWGQHPHRRFLALTAGAYAFHDRDKNFCARCIRFNFDNALLALSFYRDGCDWTSGKIAMRSPRTEPSQSSLAT